MESHFHRGESHCCVEFRRRQRSCDVREIQERLEITLVQVQGCEVWMQALLTRLGQEKSEDILQREIAARCLLPIQYHVL